MSKHTFERIDENKINHKKIKIHSNNNHVDDEIADRSSIIYKYDIDPYNYTDEELMNYAIEIFEHYKLFAHFHFEKKTLYNFLCEVKSLYHPENLFHNFKHVWGVLHICFQILLHGADDYLEYLDIFAVFISALCHDLQHPGNNNAFEEATHSDLSKIYSLPNSSTSPILENYHASLTSKLLNGRKEEDNDTCSDVGILQGLTSLQRDHLCRQVGLIILGTDMAKHTELLQEAWSYNKQKITKHSDNHHDDDTHPIINIEQNLSTTETVVHSATVNVSSTIDISEEQQQLQEDKHKEGHDPHSNRNNNSNPSHLVEKNVQVDDSMAYQDAKPSEESIIHRKNPESLISFTRVLVHAADLGAQTQSYPVAFKWMRRCFGEFNSQATKEKSLGIMTSAFLHDLTGDDKIYSAQYYFIEETVEPLWTAISTIVPDLKFALNQLVSNKLTYKKLLNDQKQC